MKRQSDNSSPKGNMWLAALRGALAACALSVALVALYALVLQKQLLGVNSVGAANIIIKLLCAAAAALIALVGCKRRAMLWGMISGAFYIVLTFAVFSLISGSFSPDAGTLADVLMCMLCGAVTGIVKNLAGK